MRLSDTLALGLAPVACATTFKIKAFNLGFSPEVINATAGDVLEFHFQPNNHSVVMGDFNNPCMPAASGGFSSGFLPVNEGENAQVFRVTLNDSSPMVYYCSLDMGQRKHCQAGMVGVVNSDAASLADYKAKAQMVAMAMTPPMVFGGELVANPNSSAVVEPNTGSGAVSGAPTMTMTGSMPGMTMGSGSSMNMPGMTMGGGGMMSMPMMSSATMTGTATGAKSTGGSDAKSAACRSARGGGLVWTALLVGVASAVACVA